jgi:Bacteriophage Sf6, terminase small subunit-like
LETSKRKRGRPSQFNWDLADEICRRIAEGETLRSICGLDRMPAHTTILRWLRENEVFRTQYARAREDQADALADEMLDAARSATNQDANAKRVLVDTLKWRAGKLRPKVYGDRMRIETEKPEDHSRLSPAELRERIAVLLRSVGVPETVL